MNRYIYFAIAILIGLVVGMYYGWVLSPVRLADTVPGILRADYKADFVLMVAEIYRSDGDEEAALERLEFFSDTNPLSTIRNALEFGLENGFAAEDLSMLDTLNTALRAYTPDPDVDAALK